MTLTKTFLLDSFKPIPKKYNHVSVGDFYVKPRTELQRCKRIGDMYDRNGNPVQEQIAKRRAYMIVDQLCDEDGSPLFKEGDVKEILALESEKLDPILEAITEVNGELEKNESGE